MEDVNMWAVAALAVPFFLVLDGIWLGVIAKDYYRNSLGKLMAKKPNWTMAAIFYVIFISGLAFFAIEPAIEADDWSMALRYGALYGLVTYSTYGFTNGATLKNWPQQMVFIDTAWGVALSAAVASLTAGAWLAWF